MKTYTKQEYIGEEKNIGLHRVIGNRDQVIHCHEFIEIVFILEGEAVEWIDECRYEVKEGDVLFINYGSSHSFIADENFVYIDICFSPTLVADGIVSATSVLSLLSLSVFNEMRKEKNGGKISFTWDERKEVKFIVDAMLKEYQSGRADSSPIIENYLNILLAKMRRACEGMANPDIIDDIWQELKLRIDENPEENLSLSSLAEKSFYNPSYLSRTFKRHFGVTLTEYIRTRRIERAKELLQDPAFTVEEIIYRVGFSDRSTFYHAFSKRTGMTPTEYRNVKKDKK